MDNDKELLLRYKDIICEEFNLEADEFDVNIDEINVLYHYDSIFDFAVDEFCDTHGIGSHTTINMLKGCLDKVKFCEENVNMEHYMYIEDAKLIVTYSSY